MGALTPTPLPRQDASRKLERNDRPAYRKRLDPDAQAQPACHAGVLASHQRNLNDEHEHNEPAGQIASRELEIVRIKGALQRAEELSDDVAAAIEGEVL